MMIMRLWELSNQDLVGYDESKMMQKYILKQQFEGFSLSNSEGLHKGYDRFQSLLSQLEIHGVGVSTEDVNQKFLRSLPSSWSQVSLVMRTKPGVDSLSFDDLYNNLRVFESDVKGSTRSSSSRRLQFDAKEPVGFDKTKVECFNCHKTGHFARECRSKGNQERKKRDAGNTRYKAKEQWRRPGNRREPKALVPLCGEPIQAQDTESKTSKSDTQTSDFNSCESNSSKETLEFVPEPVVVEPKVVSQPKSLVCMLLFIEESESQTVMMNIFSHLIRDCDFHEKRMAKQVDLNKNKGKGTSQGENRLVWNNVQRLNHQNKFVPKAVLTKTGIFPVNTARQNLSSQAATTSTARKVNTARPIVNEIRPRNNFYKSHSPIRRPFNRTTAPKANFSNQKVNNAEVKAVSVVGGIRETADNLQRALKNKGIVDSGCSRHMTRNKAYLAEYQDYNGCPVAFGGSKGYLTGKGKMK
ncbi:ribonuclease H-like domain-containing protein [Tanacetum coccineum]